MPSDAARPEAATAADPSLPSLLIADDDDALRERLVRAFQRRGYAVTGAATVADALATLADPPEYAVVDLRLFEASGLRLVQELVQADPATRVVVLTGYGSIATAVEAMRLGARHYLTKPADADAIEAALRRDDPGDAKLPLKREPLTLARAEWEHINQVLVDAGGNVSEAARRLGLHRRSLQRKLTKYPPR